MQVPNAPAYYGSTYPTAQNVFHGLRTGVEQTSDSILTVLNSVPQAKPKQQRAYLTSSAKLLNDVNLQQGEQLIALEHMIGKQQKVIDQLVQHTGIKFDKAG